MAEAAAVFGLVTGSVALIQTAVAIYNAVDGKTDERIQKVADQLLPIKKLLENAQATRNEDDPVWVQVRSEMERCEKECEALSAIFEKICPTVGDNNLRRAWKISAMIMTGKRSEAEEHLRRIMDILAVLRTHHIITNTALLEEVKAVLNGLDGPEAGVYHSGQGDNNVNWGTGTYNLQKGANSTMISAENYAASGVVQHVHMYSSSVPAMGFSFFKTSDYESFKDTLNPKRVPDTCVWFLEHQKFKDWRVNDRDDFLWLSADPGCGKSVLSRALIDESLLNTEPTLVLHFFFKDNAEQNSACVAACALLHQLFCSNEALFDGYAIPAIRLNGNLLKEAFSELWKLLMAAATAPEAGNIVCVLDALDECQDRDRKALLSSLKTFYSSAKGPGRRTSRQRLKFFVTSRPYASISAALDDRTSMFPTIKLAGEHESEAISKEIELVIRSEFEQISRDLMLQEKHQAEPLKHILGMQNRTYLWLKFILEEIRLRTPATANELLEVVKYLPPDVEDAYEQILSRSPNKPFALKLLRVVLAAQRPLTLNEIDVILGIRSGMRSRREVELAGVGSRERQIRNLCGLFVNIIDSKLYLIHQTARDFLICKMPEQANSMTWKASITLASSHYVLAEACLAYLLLDETRRFDVRDAREPPANLRHYFWFKKWKRQTNFSCSNFLQYSATHWTKHFRESDVDKDDGLTKAAMKLYATNSCITETRSAWFRIALRNLPTHHEFDEEHLVHQRIRQLYTVDRLLVIAFFGHYQSLACLLSEQTHRAHMSLALYWAATKGHTKAASTLIESGALIARDEWVRAAFSTLIRQGVVDLLRQFIDRGCRIYTIDIVAASRSGHLETVTLLLASMKGTMYGTDLDDMICASCSWNKPHDLSERTTQRLHEREKLVKMLLSERAKTSDKPFSGIAALCEASSSGHNSIVQLLLDRGGNLDASEKYRALGCASRNGHVETVRLLLDEGANANAGEGNFSDALLEASWAGNVDVVRCLLDNGADVNAGQGTEKNAFYSASRYGNVEIVRLLLERGANIHAGEGTKVNALYGASNCGKVEVVRLLLGREANIHAGEGTKFNALYGASKFGQVEAVRLLLERGANIHAGEGTRLNALYGASKFGQVEVVRLLLGGGANVNAGEGTKYGALYGASRCGRAEVVRLLLERGANVNAGDGNEYSALFGASFRFYYSHLRGFRDGRKAVTKLLLDHGARWFATECRGRRGSAGPLLNRDADRDAEFAEERWGLLYRDAKVAEEEPRGRRGSV